MGMGRPRKKFTAKLWLLHTVNFVHRTARTQIFLVAQVLK